MILIKIDNPWTYKGVMYTPGDLVQMSEELFSHVSQVAIGSEVKSQNATKVFHALIVEGTTISDAVKEKIDLRTFDDRYYFTLRHKDGDREYKLQYKVLRDPKIRIIE